MRITPQDIDKAVLSVRFDVYDRRLTVCVLTLQNGFLVTGESYVLDAAEFDAAKGRAFALTQAREKVAALLAYAECESEGRAQSVADALSVVSAVMHADAGLAWSWHCNIAMAFQDAATDALMAHDLPRLIYAANDAAARFMKQAFGVEGYAPGAMQGRRDSSQWGAEVKRDANASGHIMTARQEQAGIYRTPAVCVHADGCDRVCVKGRCEAAAQQAQQAHGDGPKRA